MKDVTIISKVVGRKEGDRPVTGGGSQAAVDLSAYLLKKTWDTAWELREKDGVPYLFGKLPVVLQSGMTSYVADEAVDLPGIYDGLPIDNQTLKWVETTDENGAVSRVLVAAGGGTGGGGSVQFPLTWSGFSNGSWDGSVAKTIVIPSKLSDLDGDVIVFEEDGWGDAFRVKPYFSGFEDDNYLAIERSVGGSGDEPFFNECLKIRGQTGKIEHICTHETAIEITHPHAPLYNWCNGIKLLNPILGSGQYEQIQFGREPSLHNCGYIAYKHQWSEVDGIRSSFVTIGLSGVDEVLNVTGYRRVGINTAAPRHDLEVNGQIGVTNNIKLYGRDYDDVEFVNNDDGCITNVQGALNPSIRHALRFNWHGDSYEIGAVCGGGAEARGFGVTYGNHTLIFEVGVGGCDFHTPVYLRKGLYVQGSAEFVDNVKFDKPTNFIGNAGDNNISFVYNEDGVITNKTYDAESIRHALRFQWFQDAYEIGAVRTGWGEAYGFGVTYNNNRLVLKVNKTQMDVYEDLKVHGNIELEGGSSSSFLRFTSGYAAYIHRTKEDFLNIYGDGGVKIYGYTDGYNEYIEMKGSGITLSTISSQYISMIGKGIQVNNGKITYNENEGYFLLDGNLLVSGGITMYSDERKKTILNHVQLSLREVADAPLIEHYYNSDTEKTTHVGSIAQYWAGLNDWFCKMDADGFYTMEVQNAALASAISVARELLKYETKTDKQIRKLKKRISELEEEVEQLKKM